MCGLITLVYVNHVDNYLKEILAFVSYGTIVNNGPNKTNTSDTEAPFLDLNLSISKDIIFI